MITTLEQQIVQQPKGINQNTKRVMTRPDAKSGAQGENPYSAKNLDDAITHVEIAVAFDDNIAVFGRRYWLERVQRMASTPLIVPAQVRRLQNLLDQLKDA